MTARSVLDGPTGGTASMLTVTAIVVAARLTSAALYCISGSGACEMAQQELSEPLESCALSSGGCMWLHGDWDIACTHSAGLEESNAQDDSGTRPATKTINAIPRINSLCINHQSSMQGSCVLSKQVRVFRRRAL
jgi:invasion protein IalB